MSGRLFGLGVGPGDPGLITLKALRLLHEVQVIAFPCTRQGHSHARNIVAPHLIGNQIELPMLYPVTTEGTAHPGGYEGAITDFYDQTSIEIAAHLTAGRDVAILCEGDPFFYGSYMYLHDRLAHRFPTQVIPGVPSIMGAAAQLSTPLVRRDAEFTVLPATLSEEALIARLQLGGAFAIMKLGRNFAKVRRALERTNLTANALFIERATMAAERIVPLAEVDPDQVPYFSLILIPGSSLPEPATGNSVLLKGTGSPVPPTSPTQDGFSRWGTLSHEHPTPSAMTTPGWIAVVGLGPGAPEWLTPEANQALAEATDLVGYHTYLNRVPIRSNQNRFGSDNKVEADRARHALVLATEGRRVCVVSSGDPGIFAMASAVLECVEAEPAWQALDIRIIPGISAMQAAASRVGAPLGHDFCVISLSDRLKPWPTVLKRLEAAACADFALALYNPISSERQWQLAEAAALIAKYRAPATPVVLARSVGRTDERILITDLAHFDPLQADMQTIILIGSSTTRTIPMQDGRNLIYTPRTYSQ